MVFTGTSALDMARKHYDHTKIIDLVQWRIYVSKEYGEFFQMKKDMCVLYQIEVSSLICICVVYNSNALHAYNW